MNISALDGVSRSERELFWDNYYSDKTTPVLPSQFAAFVANELERTTTIVDVGCGSGRDSLFFARHHFNVVGIDASSSAVEYARSTAASQNLQSAQFFKSDVKDQTLSETLAGLEGRLCVYARFFLHAIDDPEEARLLDSLVRAFKPGDQFAVEYRTDEDADTPKEAAPHFRRFVRPEAFDKRVSAIGLCKVFGVTGRGFAKHKSEDAHVARAIFELPETA